MTPLYQIPRHSLAWLLTAQAWLIAPHLLRLPVWMLVAWAITVFWRIQVYRGLWAYPGRWAKYGIVLLCVLGLVMRYDRLYGVEPMVGLLLTAFTLKLLEMHTKREALLVIFLGYFAAATGFLFSQTVLMTLYILVGLLMLTTALLGLHQSPDHARAGPSLRLAGGLILQALPLMLLLFVIMPRIGSLWAVPQPSESASTGMSDSMSPGDFSNLVQDDSLAFRVTFDGVIPNHSQLYWRGLVLSAFDGREWTRSSLQQFGGDNLVDWQRGERPSWYDERRISGESINYEVVLEPSQQHWLYAIPAATTNQSSIGVARDNRLVSRRPVNQRFVYEVSSYPNYRLQPQGLDSLSWRQHTQLPEGFNPRSLARAQQWWEEVSAQPDAYIEKVMRHFNASFTYTLQPPTLGRDSVDEFLWESQRGFCEHFASSFVFMMRAVEIPARVVVGYQGGQVNPVENFLRVRQSDAHAWAEVWLSERGWVRVDPTGAVSPERIEQGLNSALSQQEIDMLRNPLSLERFSYIAIVNILQLRLEALEYQWHRWVMGYDQQAQTDFLKNWLGNLSPWRIAAAFLSLGGLVLAIVAGWLWWSSGVRLLSPHERYYRRFLRRLARRGIRRTPGEGPRSLAKRVERERPELFPWVEQVTMSYEAHVYADQRVSLSRFKQLLRSK